MYDIAFHLGPLPIYWYGIMVTLGFGLGIWTSCRRAPLAGISGETVLDMGTWLVIGAVIGARLLYVIYFWEEFNTRETFWEAFKSWRGGLVFHGGLFGAVLAGWIFTRYRKLPFKVMADIGAPGVALGHAIGRIGCLLKGCCYGHATTMPWGICYPSYHETHGALIHPAQAYETLLDVGLYLSLAWWFPRRKWNGQIFALYLISYGVIRFIVEMFRGDSQVFYFNHLTLAQLVSFGIFISGVAFWFFGRGKTPVKA